MTCCFFGHSICPFDIRPKIKVQIEKMLTESEKVTFYIGNHGQFDSMVRGISACDRTAHICITHHLRAKRS